MVNKTIGEAIQFLRKRAGYTQKDLADRIGISDKAVSKWERGQGLPDIAYLRKLSILLDTDTDSLLAGDVVHRGRGWEGVLILKREVCGIGADTIIYDKPLVFFLLGYFLLVGIKKIHIICGQQDREYIESSIKRGKPYGVELCCYDALQSIKLEADQNYMFVYGKCFLYGVDQTRFFQKAMLERKKLTVLALPKRRDIIRAGYDMNSVASFKSEALRRQYDYSRIPIMFMPAEYAKELSKADSIQSFLDSHEDETYAEILDRGFVEIEINDWNSVQDASVFLKIVQDKCGMNVYCLEEVAWRRGFIALEQLKEAGENQAETEYGEYILSLYQRMKE